MQSQIRTCHQHHNPISYVCLKEGCPCPGILCTACLEHNHSKTLTCRIDQTSPPFSFFNINYRHSKQSQYFISTLNDICQLWDEGNAIFEKQSHKFQQTLLNQLNFICKTFEYETPNDMELNLKYDVLSQNGMKTDIDFHVQFLRNMNKYQNKVQNLDSIKHNVEKVKNTVTDLLKQSFLQLQLNFQKLNQIIQKVDIFEQKHEPMQPTPQKQQPIIAKPSCQSQPNSYSQPSSQFRPSSQSQLYRSKSLQTSKVKQSPKQTKTVMAKPAQLPQLIYKQQQKLQINKHNLKQLINKIDPPSIKYLNIKGCNSPDEVNDYLFAHSFINIQYLVIQQKLLACQDCLTLYLMCLNKLKVLVVPSTNDIWKCSVNLNHYDSNGEEATLDRLEYFYDFRRNLEQLDLERYFSKTRYSVKFAQQRSYQPERRSLKEDTTINEYDYWGQGKKYLNTKDTMAMIKKFKLKNIWIANLNKAQFANLKENDLSFKDIQEAILGYHDQIIQPIPLFLQDQLKNTTNLKSLVLIKTNHFVLNFSNMLKKMPQLETLVLEQFKCMGNEIHQQSLYNNLPNSCPLLTKLQITDLENIDISFISKLTHLTTLILIRSKNLKIQCEVQSLQIQHLNLSNWNYAKLLTSLKPNKIHYLNLGLTKTDFPNISTTLLTFNSLQSMCVDGHTLTQQFLTIIQMNEYCLKHLSIALCRSHSLSKLPQILKKCQKIIVLDIHKLDMEADIFGFFPNNLQTLIVSPNSPHRRQQFKLYFTQKNIQTVEVSL